MTAQMIFAIPSKGRLKEQVEAWLAECGFKLEMTGGSRGYSAELSGLPGVSVRLLSAGDIADAVAAMHDGAYDFVAKPFPFERLQDSLNRALEKRSLVLENRRLVAMAAEGGHELPLAGSSRAITALRATIAQIADARMDVLIEGETGVGKEAVARALHNGGRRRLAPFVAVNCGALPDGLIESELFGHELGAFAGAMRRRVGHVERAHNGSLFLDEVESMPLAVQVKMLRVLEEREIHPIGANEPRVLDLRILASAKIDLSEAARRGDFREDLYYRLNVVNLRIPPLRERMDDILPLARFFLDRYAVDFKKRVSGFSPEAIEKIRRQKRKRSKRAQEKVLANKKFHSQKQNLRKPPFE